MKFYVCKHCGNIIQFAKESGVPVMCCGQKMEELVPGSTDGAVEKHVPVITIDGNAVVVTVGSTKHPMMENHYIEWIILETKKGYQKVKLSYTDEPYAKFLLTEGDSVIAAYEYCNIHGLWQANDMQ